MGWGLADWDSGVSASQVSHTGKEQMEGKVCPVQTLK